MVQDRKPTSEPPRLHRFTLEQWHRMREAGILTEDERLEFVDGQVVEMSPVNRPHASCVKRLLQAFSLQLGDRVIVSVQDPLLVGTDEFYPDVVLLKPRPDFYHDKDASAEDALLVVEVADTSLATDQGLKASKYAAGGVVEYWVVDLNGARVWVYREPKNGVYTRIQALEGSAYLTPLALPSVQLTVEQVLGRTTP
ncbi:Uma2 family endonuclease [Meiothermus sp. CFH 77666]|uniref:Uma2 family endonuclease n=1 Tax=Meiothermus sp. CFH 77666 TaxID=2817942 RepID=UPI001AA0120C|nr:Uma2 family endonuclease [Meiothermus sp. CFH 77666]MBO1437039.1 Uma2 family endonuclease [Meiothermus sp. CFH 77666]